MLVGGSNWNAAITNVFSNYIAFGHSRDADMNTWCRRNRVEVADGCWIRWEIFEFKRLDAGIVNIDGAGSEMIDAATTYVLTKPW